MAATVKILDTQFDDGKGGTREMVIDMYTVDAKECLRSNPDRFKPFTPKDTEVLERVAVPPDPGGEKTAVNDPDGAATQAPPAEGERGVRGGPRRSASGE